MGGRDKANVSEVDGFSGIEREVGATVKRSDDAWLGSVWPKGPLDIAVRVRQSKCERCER